MQMKYKISNLMLQSLYENQFQKIFKIKYGIEIVENVSNVVVMKNWNLTILSLWQKEGVIHIEIFNYCVKNVIGQKGVK